MRTILEPLRALLHLIFASLCVVMMLVGWRLRK